MNIDRVIGSYFIGAVPIALVLFGLASFGIIALRKTPGKKEDTKNTHPEQLQRSPPKKLRDRKRR